MVTNKCLYAHTSSYSGSIYFLKLKIFLHKFRLFNLFAKWPLLNLLKYLYDYKKLLRKLTHEQITTKF